MTSTYAAPTGETASGPAAPYSFADLDELISRMTGDEKHAPSSTSTRDVVWVLYDRILRVGPGTVADPGRDRFYLSKGHGPMAFYAVLAAKGMLDPDLLHRYGDYDNPLGYHPDRLMLPDAGVEMSSGSLGHGLPLAIGAALALRSQRISDPRLWVLVGDAELDEGSNHEAIAFAGRHGLDRLHVVVIDNDSATLGWPSGLETRFAAEGWATHRVDGRDHAALEAAFTQPHPGRPHAIIAEVERKDDTPRRSL